MNYYNEFDPHAAAWLQGLIDENLIPSGHVDTRSITEISPSDLHGYTQCHFFAGIGGWPLALQLAGVPATRPLWTGSCPCQPFSVAGEGKGTEDERHLWPVFFGLIRACNPPLVLGEQVASAAVLGSSAKPSQRGSGKPVQPVWLDGVFADLESASYACGSSDIPAAGIGAPHIRQRCWWGAIRMADAEFPRREATGLRHEIDTGRELESGCSSGGLADSFQSRLEGHAGNGEHGDEPRRIGANQAGSAAEGGKSGGMGHSNGQSTGRNAGSAHAAEAEHGPGESDNHGSLDAGDGLSGRVAHAKRDDRQADEQERGPEGGDAHRGISHWDDAYWHPCRDGKYRRAPVEPRLFPLVDGVSYRVARRRSIRPPLLRGAGNAIVPEVGAEFVKSFLKSIGGI